MSSGTLYAPPHTLMRSSAGVHRQYMRGVTAIDPAWLPDLAAGTQMCQWGEVLSVPPPRFDEALDQVMCHRRAYFGPLRWELPLTKVRIRWRRSRSATAASHRSHTDRHAQLPPESTLGGAPCPGR